MWNRKIFSVWRNLRYVFVGVLVLSVSLSFLFFKSSFPYGGAVGEMISNWLISMLGIIGTGALLLVAFFAYIIWQFNPVFKLPANKTTNSGESSDNPDLAEKPVINKISEYGLNEHPGRKTNDIDALIDFKLVEKDESLNEIKKAFEEPVVEKEIVQDILHEHELNDYKKFSAEKNKQAILN